MVAPPQTTIRPRSAHVEMAESLVHCVACNRQLDTLALFVDSQT